MKTLKFQTFPVLQTAHLLLRQLSANDAQDIFLLRSDKKVNEFLDREGISTLRQSFAFIKKIETVIKKQQSLYWAIEIKDLQLFIGTICLWNFSPHHNTAEIGFELSPSFQGLGLMQEAVTTVITFGFTTLQLSAITAFTVKENKASIKLLKKNYFLPDSNYAYTSKEEASVYSVFYLKKDSRR